MSKSDTSSKADKCTSDNVTNILQNISKDKLGLVARNNGDSGICSEVQSESVNSVAGVFSKENDLTVKESEYESCTETGVHELNKSQALSKSQECESKGSKKKRKKRSKKRKIEEPIQNIESDYKVKEDQGNLLTESFQDVEMTFKLCIKMMFDTVTEIILVLDQLYKNSKNTDISMLHDKMKILRRNFIAIFPDIFRAVSLKEHEFDITRFIPLLPQIKSLNVSMGEILNAFNKISEKNIVSHFYFELAQAKSYEVKKDFQQLELISVVLIKIKNDIKNPLDENRVHTDMKDNNEPVDKNVFYSSLASLLSEISSSGTTVHVNLQNILPNNCLNASSYTNSYSNGNLPKTTHKDNSPIRKNISDNYIYDNKTQLKSHKSDYLVTSDITKKTCSCNASSFNHELVKNVGDKETLFPESALNNVNNDCNETEAVSKSDKKELCLPEMNKEECSRLHKMENDHREPKHRKFLTYTYPHDATENLNLNHTSKLKLQAGKRKINMNTPQNKQLVFQLKEAITQLTTAMKEEADALNKLDHSEETESQLEDKEKINNSHERECFLKNESESKYSSEKNVEEQGQQLDALERPLLAEKGQNVMKPSSADSSEAPCALAETSPRVEKEIEPKDVIENAEQNVCPALYRRLDDLIHSMKILSLKGPKSVIRDPVCKYAESSNQESLAKETEAIPEVQNTELQNSKQSLKEALEKLKNNPHITILESATEKNENMCNLMENSECSKIKYLQQFAYQVDVNVNPMLTSNLPANATLIKVTHINDHKKEADAELDDSKQSKHKKINDKVCHSEHLLLDPHHLPIIEAQIELNATTKKCQVVNHTGNKKKLRSETSHSKACKASRSISTSTHYVDKKLSSEVSVQSTSPSFHHILAIISTLKKTLDENPRAFEGKCFSKAFIKSLMRLKSATVGEESSPLKRILDEVINVVEAHNRLPHLEIIKKVEEMVNMHITHPTMISKS